MTVFTGVSGYIDARDRRHEFGKRPGSRREDHMKQADFFKIILNTAKRNGVKGLFGLLSSYVNLCREPIKMSTLPLMIQLEPTTYCNLECKMCVNPISNRKNINISLAGFKKIIDDIPYLKKLSIVGAGEPVMNPHLFDMVGYAKSKGISVGFATNGMLLTEEICKKIFSSRADWLNISLDSPRKETYEKIRKGADFDKVLENIRRLVRLKGDGHIPELSVWFVIMKDNLEELPELIRLVKELGIRKVSAQLEHNWGEERIRKDMADRNSGNFAGRVKDVLDEALKYSKSLGMDFEYVNVPDTSSGRACKWPWKSCYITAEGFVTPCCLQGSNPKVINFGNVLSDDFKNIWNGSAYQAFRRSIKSGTIPSICVGCTSYHKKLKT